MQLVKSTFKSFNLQIDREKKIQWFFDDFNVRMK